LFSECKTWFGRVIAQSGMAHHILDKPVDISESETEEMNFLFSFFFFCLAAAAALLIDGTS
jgi:hypothetical protein